MFAVQDNRFGYNSYATYATHAEAMASVGDVGEGERMFCHNGMWGTFYLPCDDGYLVVIMG